MKSDPKLADIFAYCLEKVTTIEELKRYINEENSNTLLDHNEIMLLLCIAALTDVVVKTKDYESTAEAIVQRIFIKHFLGMDLPIIQITSAKGHPPVIITEEMQKQSMQNFTQEIEPVQRVRKEYTGCTYEQLITPEHLKAFAENGIDAPELVSLWQ